MDPRFGELFRVSPNTHQKDCPVVLSTGVLFRDNYNGQVLAQVVLGNLSMRSVVACKIEIRTFSVNGQDLDTLTYQYMDMRVAPNGFFGGNVSIALPNPATRRIHVVVREVVLDPFKVWTCEDEVQYPMPQPARIDSVLPNPRHQHYYSSIIGKPAMCAPRQDQGLFLCTCGQLNMADEGPCRRCGSTFEMLDKALNPEKIGAAVAEMIRQEEEARIAAEKAAEEARIQREKEAAEKLALKKARQKKARKVFLTVAAILVAMVLLAGLTVKVIIPAVETSNTYKSAVTMMSEGRFEDAESTFLSLGDYKDASAQALECRYQIAQRLLDNGDYAAAIDTWNQISGYADSDARAEDALIQWKEQDYQNALALKESGAYMEASDAFAQLDGYKDSDAQQAECAQLQKDVDYHAAMAAMEAGDYKEAMKLFADLGNYENATEMFANAAYLQAAALFEAKDYSAAADYFQKAGQFEDAPQRYLEATYQYGCKQLADKKYAAAISIFERCEGYSDTARKVMDAKYGYCQEHKDASNKTTYNYLKELVSAYYYGAQALYNEVFGWKVVIVAFNNNPYDNVTNQTSLSKYQTMCVHFKVSGGEPGATQNIRTVITLPSGYSGTVYHTGAKDGDVLCTYGWYDTPSYAPAGTLYFQAYDEAGNLLASASVRVTN